MRVNFVSKMESPKTEVVSFGFFYHRVVHLDFETAFLSNFDDVFDVIW